MKDIRNELPGSNDYPTRDVSQITHIDIHHSASLTRYYKGLETIEGFANYHINTHGWPGIGYHYIVTPDGEVFKTGYANEMRWSVGRNNSYTISIMLIGSFDQEDISDKQYQVALKLISEVRKAYNVSVDKIKGHKEFSGHNSNACPGIDMDILREDVFLLEDKQQEEVQEDIEITENDVKDEQDPKKNAERFFSLIVKLLNTIFK